MSALLLPLFELVVLFLLSGLLTRKLSRLFHRMTKSRKMTVYLLSIFFLPGTLIHELSHFLMAAVLFVPTGKLSLMPELQEDGHTLRMGSLEVAKTDPFRGVLIGVAPLLMGTIIITGSLFLVGTEHLLTAWWTYVVMGYVLFEIGNTMFSSRKDLEGALELLLLLVILLPVLYFLGVKFPVLHPHITITPQMATLLHQAGVYLAIPLAIDIIVVGLLSLIKNPVY